MSAKTIKSALGLLQDDPDNTKAWRDLREEVAGDPGMSPAELGEAPRGGPPCPRGAARVRGRRASSLELEVGVAEEGRRPATSSPSSPASSTKSCSTTRAARDVYERLVGHGRRDPARGAGGRGARRGGRQARQVARARRALRQRGPRRGRPRVPQLAAGERRRGHVPLRARRAGRGRRAHRARCCARRSRSTPRTAAAELLLERVLRGEERWDELVDVLERFATEAVQKDEQHRGAGCRLARRLREEAQVARPRRGRGLRAGARPLPGHPEATGFLVDHFTSHEMWEHLVALYEGQLSSGRPARQGRGARRDRCRSRWCTGGCAASPRRRSRGSRSCASSSRRTPGCSPSSASGAPARGESARLATILTEAQRAMPRRARSATSVVAEIAKLAEEGANAQKAIEQWRTHPAAGPEEQGGARRAQAPLPADRGLERADRSAAPGAREAPAGRRRGGACSRAARDRRRLPRPRQERLGARDGALADRAARPGRSAERARARARVRGAAALARSARRCRRGRPSSSPRPR